MSSSRLLALLALVLFCSTVVPCGLGENGEAPCCDAGTAASLPGDASEAPADDVHLDCCAGCLTCCARYVAGAVAVVPEPPRAVPTVDVPTAPRPSGSDMLIWRPPQG